MVMNPRISIILGVSIRNLSYPRAPKKEQLNIPPEGKKRKSERKSS